MADQKKPGKIQEGWKGQEQGKPHPLAALHEKDSTSDESDDNDASMEIHEDSSPTRQPPQVDQPPGLKLPPDVYRYEEWLGRPIKELPTPPEVMQAFARELGEMKDQGRPVVGAFKERLLEDYKVQFYFGGQPIAYRETDAGKTVLAVGYGQIGELRRQLNVEENEAVTTGFAETW